MGDHDMPDHGYGPTSKTAQLLEIALMAFDPQHPKYRDNLATRTAGTIALRRLRAAQPAAPDAGHDYAPQPRRVLNSETGETELIEPHALAVQPAAPETERREQLRKAIQEDIEIERAGRVSIDANLWNIVHLWAFAQPAAPETERLREALRNSANGLHNFARMAKVPTHETAGWRDCPAMSCVEARAAIEAGDGS